MRLRLGALACAVGWLSLAAVGEAADVHVSIDARRPVATFTPNQALGVALDGMERGDTAATLTPFNIARIRTADLRRVTYRTRPELGIEVWHWTEAGTWSDPARRQGYWTGDPAARSRAELTWGYSLPRRGDTIDNANNLGFSRIDDGDPASFWKSNPYLDRRYTGLAHSRPQWIVMSFKQAVSVDSARILWGAPYARHFLVQYWKGDEAYWEGKEVASGPGAWTTFPHGDVTLAGPPQDGVIRLANEPLSVHFVRILMLESSQTAPAGSTDVRDGLGYAVREIGFGVARPDGTLDDAVTHRADTQQTLVQVSSTDPWHRAIDRDRDTEQPSLDFVLRSGLAGDRRLMVPVGVFYDTPENAAAEVRYIERQGWPVRQVELGEEPDGQFIRPEDYADLYLQAARLIHAADPALELGGPSMQNALTGTWPDTEEGTSWTGRFVAELKARGGLGQLQFFSFEHYVFDQVCREPGVMLRDETDALNRIMRETSAAGMPAGIPWIISEYGFSPFAGEQMSRVSSALLAADIVGHFLTLGGRQAFMFGYTPDTPENQNFPCAGFGNMMLYEADDAGRARWPMPEYWAERMMLDDWGAPAGRAHDLYGANTDLADDQGRPMVVAYPLRGPDGRWSVMLINRDGAAAHTAALTLAGAPLGPLRVVQYSAAEYAWLERGEESRPTRDRPPARFASPAGAEVALPALSLTVVSTGAPLGATSIAHQSRNSPIRRLRRKA